jgi:acyl-coenzyme A thioesterase PaaI-like protein
VSPLAGVDPALHDAAAVRERVLDALLDNRTPGFHFPGYLIDVRWEHIEADRARLRVPAGPHLADASGDIDPIVLAVLADVALGTAARLPHAHNERQATIHMQLQLTGVPARGTLAADARWRGCTHATSSTYTLADATLAADTGVVAYASGTFARVQAPQGVSLAPLPWHRDGSRTAPRLGEQDLDPGERALLRHCDAALARDGASFMRSLWGGESASSAEGACRRLVPGPLVGNRVGHVHGGILLALAMTCATDAVPARMRLANTSAWFLRPGAGDALTACSTCVHEGTTTSLVRTVTTASDGTRVMETVTQHVLARGHGDGR